MPQGNEGSADQNKQNADKRISTVFSRIVGRRHRIFSESRGPNVPSTFTKTYTDPIYGFSFSYPPDLRIEARQDGAVWTILARHAGKATGVQISVRPIAGTDAAITPARIAHDMPGLAIREPQPVRSRGAGPALAFYTTERKFGDSFHTWFIRDGHLFQVSSYAPHAALVRGVFTTWTFTT